MLTQLLSIARSILDRVLCTFQAVRLFPESIETDSLTLEQFSDSHMDVFELSELFEAGRDDVDAVFESVPQEPYASVKEARDQL